MRRAWLLLILVVAQLICARAQDYSDTSTTTTTHEYVDLGLSVNWATCNVGAYKPEEYGTESVLNNTKNIGIYWKSLFRKTYYNIPVGYFTFFNNTKTLLNFSALSTNYRNNTFCLRY